MQTRFGKIKDKGKSRSCKVCCPKHRWPMPHFKSPQLPCLAPRPACLHACLQACRTCAFQLCAHPQGTPASSIWRPCAAASPALACYLHRLLTALDHFLSTAFCRLFFYWLLFSPLALQALSANKPLPLLLPAAICLALHPLGSLVDRRALALRVKPHAPLCRPHRQPACAPACMRGCYGQLLSDAGASVHAKDEGPASLGIPMPEAPADAPERHSANASRRPLSLGPWKMRKPNSGNIASR